MMEHDILDFEKVVPKPLLTFYLEKMEVETDKRSIESIYNALNDENPELIKKLYNDYKNVGVTAINIFETGIECTTFTKDVLVEFLKNLHQTDDVFSKEFKPILTNEPQINYIENRDESILIEFVMLGRSRKVRDGYDIKVLQPVEFEVAIVHFDIEGQVLIELRCAYSQRKKYLEKFTEYFRDILHDSNLILEWNPITKVSNLEAEKIAEKLSAGLVEAEHKDDGIYDKHIVSASPTVANLREQQEYIEDFKNKMLLSQVLNLVYIEKTDYGEYKSEIRFKINLNTGFQFLSKVNEEVVEYVMKVFREVRYSTVES